MHLRNINPYKHFVNCSAEMVVYNELKIAYFTTVLILFTFPSSVSPLWPRISDLIIHVCWFISVSVILKVRRPHLFYSILFISLSLII